MNQDEMLRHPNYLLSTYQLEIYHQLSLYMKEHKLQNKDIADKLKVSTSYVSQILNGNFNFTLKKLIQLGLMMNKVPYLEFIDPKEYWRREKEGTKEIIVKEYHYTIAAQVTESENGDFSNFWNGNTYNSKGGSLPVSVTTTSKKQPAEV
jgi:transcriptional regulator with XRE-family HTH domain